MDNTQETFDGISRQEERCKVCKEEFDLDDMYDEGICTYCNYRKEYKKEIKEFEKLLDKHSYSQEEELQDLAFSLHTQSNCHCEHDENSFTLVSEGAGDIEMCLNCYGAKGCVY